MTNLLLPVFISYAPPEHTITSILLVEESPQKTFIVTGSQTGNVCVWNYDRSGGNKENQLYPRVFMPAQDISPVVALANCLYDWRDSIVVVTEDGSVTIFSASDGQCLAATRPGAFKCEPMTAVLLKGRYLAAGGKTSELEIMDINTRKIVRRIYSHQTWIRDIVCCTVEDMPMFATLSAAGFVRFFAITEDLFVKPRNRASNIATAITASNISGSGTNTPLSHSTTISVTDTTTQTTSSLGASGFFADSDGDLRSQNSDEDCVPIQQFLLDINDAQKIAFSSDSQMLLVVGVQQWVLFSLRGSRLLLEGQVPDSYMGVSCDFLSPSSFVIWTKRGKGFIFDIPKEVLGLATRTPSVSTPPTKAKDTTTPATSTTTSTTTTTTTTTTTLTTTAAITTTGTTTQKQATPVKASSVKRFKEMDDTTDEMDTSRFDLSRSRSRFNSAGSRTSLLRPMFGTCNPTKKCSLKYKGEPVKYVDNIKVSYGNKTVICGFNEGYLTLWDKAQLLSATSRSIISPDSSGSFSSGWPAQQPSTNLPTQALQSSRVPSNVPVVSATLLLENELVLINGYTDGMMCIRNLPYDKSPITWRAHDSKINCIAILHTISGNKYILTGSDDYYVKVWMFQTQIPVACFAAHSGKVLDVFPAWKQGAPKAWRNKFFSVGSDHSVILYQLDSEPPVKAIFGTHSSDINGVKWNVDQDYLMVGCVDGSVSLWEMETGELEQCLYGKTAQEIFSNADHLAKASKLQKLKDFNHLPVTGFVTDGLHVNHWSPIQCIIFNVKHLATDLAKQLEEYEGSTGVTNGNNNGVNNNNEEDDDSALLPPIITNLVPNKPPITPPTPTPTTQPSPSSIATTHPPTTTTSTATPAPIATTNNTNGTHLPNVWDIPFFRAFSYFLPWGFDPVLDHVMHSELSLNGPTPSVTYGLIGTSGRVSMLVPNLPASSRWKTSSTVTALHTLSAAALSKVLLLHGNNANACSQILSHMCALIPEKTPGYVDPSLSFLARYWQDQMDDVMHSARAIFMSVIDRLELAPRRELARNWSSLLQNAADTDANRKSKSLAVLVLGILGSERPDSLTPEISTQVTMAIMDLLFQESSAKLRVAAVELLGKGFGEWSKHIEDVNQVIQKLFKLSILHEPKSLTTTAHHALMLIGAREPLKFLRAVGRRFQSNNKGSKNNTTEDPGEHAQALSTIGALVKKNPAALLTVLPVLVDSVVRSLDPHVPYLRNACLKSATTLVHDLVRRFPMVAFHQHTQRLAVGTKDGLIFIYDLISATRWFTLEGHKYEVTAVAFEPEGNYLSSYSLEECLIKIWKISPGFLGILGSNPTCSKTVKVSRSSKNVTAALLLEPAVRLQWTDSREFLLIRTWEPDDQRILTLKRDK